MVKHNVIFCKDKNWDKGYVYVTIFAVGEKPKRVSTKVKIAKELYYTHKNDETQRFNATRTFDFTALNTEIDNIVTSFSQSHSTNTDFIDYFKTFIDKQLNGGTKSNYMAYYNRLKIEHPTGLEISEVNNLWLKKYKNILYTKYFLSHSYIKGIMMVINSCANSINDDHRFKGISNISLNIKDLKLKMTKVEKRNMLCDADVKKLIGYKYQSVKPTKKNEILFEYITFGLCQLFARGSRFSDLLFLRHANFRQHGIVIQLPKTEDFKTIPYSLMLLRTLHRYVFRESIGTETELNNMVGLIPEAEKVVMDGLKRGILNYVSEKNEDDFFFSFVPPELYNYNSGYAFTDEEFKVYSNARGKYNGYLRRFARSSDFDHQLTSHAFRYKFVANCREEGIGIYEISTMLCHSSVKVTENYMNRHFEDENKKDYNNEYDRKYLAFK